MKNIWRIPPEGESEPESGSSGASVVGATVAGGASVSGSTVVGAWVVGTSVYGGASVGHTGGAGTAWIRNMNVIHWVEDL